MQDYVILKPTKCAVVDIGRMCQIKCDFCYYIWQDGKKEWMPWDEAKRQIDDSKERGNTLIDVTGGEPTLYPHMKEFVEYAHSTGQKVCIITNGLCGESKLNSLIEVGTDIFRISMHGMLEAHDKIVHKDGARKEQIRFLYQLENNSKVKQFHLNYVLVKDTQNDLVDFAKEYSKYSKFKKFAIINFLPHYEWSASEKAVQMVADLRVAQSQIEEAFSILEGANIGCDIRYYPMCRIKESLRRTVCNDLQVMFDPWEWDYSANPKTFDFYKAFGENISNNIEEKGQPCCNCSIHKVCGGINKAMNKSNPGMIDPIHGEIIDDPFHYRKFNLLTQVKHVL